MPWKPAYQPTLFAETDANALAATKLIMKYLPIAVKDGKNLEARQQMALASYYAGLAFTKAGVGYVHAIAHNSARTTIPPHGLANAIVPPHILGFRKTYPSIVWPNWLK